MRNPRSRQTKAGRAKPEAKPPRPSMGLLALLKELSIPAKSINAGRGDRFEDIVPVGDLRPRALSFINQGNEKYLKSLGTTRGGVVLVESRWGLDNRRPLGKLDASIILVDNPRLAVARIIKHLRLEDELLFPGVHPTAIVDPGAKIHPTAAVGPFCVIGRCEIGEGTRVGAFCHIDHRAVIGKNVLIREHCTVGGHSLGFVRDAKSAWTRIGHIGGCVIEDDVELFPYANVDRATLGETRVRRGAVIGFYVLVGHNSTVGEDAMITAGVVLCGQSGVGARSWLGVGSIVKQGVHVGTDCMVGLGAVVLNDVPDGSVVAGVPARELKGDAR